MKRLIMISVLLFAVKIGAAEKYVKTNLSGVKVYLRGAELQHTANVKLEKGISDIVFTGLSSSINQNSINVSAKGNLVIMSVVQRTDYLRENEKNPIVKSLNDSLEILNKKIVSKQNDTDALNSEIDLINANRYLGSKDKPATIAQIQKMGEFVRKRTGEIKNQISSIDYDIKKIQKDVDRIKKQLAELNNKLNQPENQLVVTVSSNAPVTSEFTLSYVTPDAGWQPAYNIRVDNINSQASLNYEANVHQNTGIDWNNVDIILSTRNPQQNNNKPELNPWFIDFQKPPVLYRGADDGAMRINSQAKAAVMSLNREAETLADSVEVRQTQLAVEFHASMAYTIPADNKPHMVALKNYSLPAKYEYYAAPKLDNNAFLVAYVTDWNDYNLLPGQANIYFENSYVGQTYINPQSVKDTLAVSMGRDEGITVTKQVLKDYTEDKFLSSDVERTFAYNITIRNNKSIPVKVLVEEQIPISKNEDIQVKLIDDSGAVYNSSDGKIKWEVQLDGSKSIVKKLVYSVRYPSDKNIAGL